MGQRIAKISGGLPRGTTHRSSSQAHDQVHCKRRSGRTRGVSVGKETEVGKGGNRPDVEDRGTP